MEPCLSQGEIVVAALSGALLVNKALSNAWFRERGLFSLKEHWRQLRAQSVIGPAQLKLDLG